MQLVDGKLVNPEIRIETTNRCNGRCVICPREKMTRSLMDMNMDLFKRIVDQSLELGAEFVSLFGYGEPLLDKHLSEKIAYCTRNGLESFITTNASLLTLERGQELVEAGLSHIRFSLHGIDKAGYEAIHRNFKYEMIMENVRNFLGFTIPFYEADTVTSISVIPMNGESVSKIKKKWVHKANYLEIWRPHNWTNGRGYREVKPQKATCGRPWNGPLQFLADGRVQVCCFDFNGKLIIGDIYLQTIKEILNGRQLRAIQIAHETESYGRLLCATCDQRNIEKESPLLYSSRDDMVEIGKTSSTKFRLL